MNLSLYQNILHSLSLPLTTGKPRPLISHKLSLIHYRLRLWSYNIVKSKAFQTIAYTVTILSTLVLAVESPVPVQPGLYCILQETVLYFDIAILVWFFIEMFLKVSHTPGPLVN